MWPFYIAYENHFTLPERERRVVSIPFFARTDSPTLRSRSYGMFFTHTVDRNAHTDTWGFPWPLWMSQRDLNTGERTSLRIAPFYENSQLGNVHRHFVMWPVFRWKTQEEDAYRYSRSDVFLVLERDIHEVQLDQDRMLNNVNTMIEENRNALQQTLANVDSITAKLDRGDGTLAKLLNDGSLYDHANAMVADLQKISDRLARGQGDLGRLVNSDGALYDDVRETVARLNVTVSNLEEISGQVRDGQGTLGRIVQDDQLYQDAQSTLHSVNRAATGIEDQSPISVLGTLVTTLF